MTKTPRQRLIDKGGCPAAIDALVEACLSAHKPLTTKRKQHELTLVKKHLNSLIKRIESDAADVEQTYQLILHAASFGLPVAESLRPVPVAVNIPTRYFFTTQAAQLRSCVANLKQLRDHIVKQFRTRDKPARTVLVLYAYCKEVANGSRKDVADLLSREGLNIDETEISNRIFRLKPFYEVAKLLAFEFHNIYVSEGLENVATH